MMEFHVIVLLSFLVLLSIPQLASLILLIHRRHEQPIKYRGVSLIFLSGIAIYLAWVWHMLFLMYQVSDNDNDASASNLKRGMNLHPSTDAIRDDDAEEREELGAPTGLRVYFCGDYQWILWMCNCTIITCYFLRSYRILKIFHDHSHWVSPLALQQQLNSEHSGPVTAGLAHVTNHGSSATTSATRLLMVPTHGTRSWCCWNGTPLTSGRIYTEKYLLKLLLFILVILVGIKLGLDHSSHPVIYSAFGCRESTVWGWLIVDGVEIALLLIAVWKLRSIRDDYGLSTELTTVSVIWILCSIGLGIAVFLHHSGTTHWFDGSSLGWKAYMEFQASVWAVRNFAIFFTSITWPLIQSYYNSFPPLWSNCDALCSLETLLKDVVCIQYFHNYLMSINRVEWILCWVEMELFKDLDPDDTDLIGAHARRIYEKYIQLGSELEVHLSPSIVHIVTRDVHVGRPAITCFEEAQRELLALMEAEFPRFLSSPSCESCLHELEKEEWLRTVLEKSGMIESPEETRANSIHLGE